MSWEKHKVVLLPTDKESIIYKDDTRVYYAPNYRWAGSKPHHLYILSDEEIKEGDLKINEPYYYFGRIFFFKETTANVHRAWKDYSKILASTDKSLNIQIMEDNEENAGFGGYYIWDDKYPGQYIPKYLSDQERQKLIQSNIPVIPDEFIQQWIDAGCPEEIEVMYEVENEEYFKVNDILPSIEDYTKVYLQNWNNPATINCRLIEHNCGLSKYEYELDKLADKIKSTESSLECVNILKEFIDKKLMEL